MNRFSLHMTRPEPPDTFIGAAQVDAVATEPVLFEAFVEAVRSLDPDILLGYDVRKVGVSAEVVAGNLRGQWLPVVTGRIPKMANAQGMPAAQISNNRNDTAVAS